MIRSTDKNAVLSYKKLSRFGRFTLLEIRPLTGRSHQIRVQLSSRGWPIVGDKKYGSANPVKGFIGLHAASLTFLHPTSKEGKSLSKVPGPRPGTH